MPTLTKDVTIIWLANAITVVACYIYAFYLKQEVEENDMAYEINETGDDVLGKPMEQPNFFPKFVLQAFKALDYGSGQERGARK